MPVHLITSRVELERLGADWNGLLEQDATAPLGMDATASFEWAAALVDSFLPGGGWSVLVATDQGGIAGILPIYRVATVRPDAPRGAVAQLTELYAGRMGFLVREGGTGILSEMLEFLQSEVDDWTTFDFHVVCGGRSESLLKAAQGGSTRNLQRLNEQLSPFIAFPESLDAYFASLTSGLRKEVRRYERRLRERGTLECRVFESPKSVDELWDAVVSIERHSWKESERTSITATAFQERFYRELLPRVAASGQLMSGVLWLDGVPVAHRLSIRFADTALALKTSYREEFKDYSPSTVLRWMYFQEIHRRGIRAYDLMGNCDQHKMRWTDRTYSRVGYRLFRNDSRGRVARLRAAASRLFRR